MAFSRNPKEWEAYMNREDNLFLNYDEYGKSVVDYALEFKNYDFIKFLMEMDIWNLTITVQWEMEFRLD